MRDTFGGTQTMEALVLHAPADLRWEEARIPRPRPGWVLVEVAACGVCGSDPHRVMVSGCYRHPMIVGHEFSGIVAALGAGVKTTQVGDRVAVVPIIPCGTCAYCQMGEYAICDNYDFLGSRSNGAMASYVTAPAANCVPVPDGVSLEAAALSDPACVALHGLRKLPRFEAGYSVAIIGAGPIGLFMLQWARALGAGQTIVLDLEQDKLTLARSLGADLAIHVQEEDPAENVFQATAGKGVHVVAVCAGSVAAQKVGVSIARKLGYFIHIGTPHADVTFTEAEWEAVRRKELSLFGTINYRFAAPLHEWQVALEFMQDGRLHAEPLITHRCELKEGPALFPRLYSRDLPYCKVLFVPNGGRS